MTTTEAARSGNTCYFSLLRLLMPCHVLNAPKPITIQAAQVERASVLPAR